MRHKLIVGFLLCAGVMFSQDGDDDFNFDPIEIKVEKEEPRVSISASRKIPKFPELPIKRDYLDEILNRFDNTVYYVQRRKILITANIEEEVNKLN